MTTMASTNFTDNSSEPVHEPLGLVDNAEAYIYPPIFAVIFIVGIVGNGTLIYIVLRNKEMRNTPNIFIVSLAVGDLLLILVSVPFTSTIYTLTAWPYGSVICKMNEFLQTLSLGVSIFTLTALSGDRYVAIVHPMSTHRGSSTMRTLGIAGAIWLLSLSLALPDILSANVQTVDFHNVLYDVCNETVDWAGKSWYPKFRAAFRFVIYFMLPVFVIVVFYALMACALIKSSSRMPVDGQRAGQTYRQTEARKKVARLVLSFVFVFIVCWLPRHIYLMWWHFDSSEFNLAWASLKGVGFCLAFINSCVNPIALYFLSKQFRCYYKRYLFRCCIKQGHHENNTESFGLLSRGKRGEHSRNMSSRNTSNTRINSMTQLPLS